MSQMELVCPGSRQIDSTVENDRKHPQSRLFKTCLGPSPNHKVDNRYIQGMQECCQFLKAHNNHLDRNVHLNLENALLASHL